MKRPILSEYGPERSMGSRASNGGKMPVRDVMNYKPPQGPTNMMRQGPGLGGTNMGNCGTQCKTGGYGAKTSGSPGLHGERMPNGGQQGKR